MYIVSADSRHDGMTLAEETPQKVALDPKIRITLISVDMFTSGNAPYYSTTDQKMFIH